MFQGTRLPFQRDAAGHEPLLDRLERYLLCLGVFLAPMRVLRPTEFAFTYSDLAFCLLGIMLIIRRRMLIAPFQDATVIWFAAILFLIGGLFASSIVNGAAAEALVVCTQYFFAYGFLPFIILRNDRHNAVLVVKTYVYACFWLVMCGFVFVVIGYDGNGDFVTGSGRLASLTANPNNLGIQIGLVMPLLMYLWFSKSLSLPVCLAIVIVLVIGLIMTSSNTGLAAAALGFTMFMLFARSFKWMIQALVLVVTIILVVGTVGYDYLPEVFQRRVLQGLESGDIDQSGTYRDRLELIVEATERLDSSLLLGIGAEQYREQSRLQLPVHNQYLLLWIEGGTIAFFGWLLILLTFIMVGLRGYARQDGAVAAAAVLSVAFVFIFIANSTPHLYARSWILPVLATMSLALSGRLKTAFSQATPPRQPDPVRPTLRTGLLYPGRRSS